MPSRLIATSLALIAFAVAILAGIVADNTATTTLWRALVAMFACYLIGSVLGAIAQRALTEHIDQYKREHPIDGDAAQDPISEGPPAAARGAARDDDGPASPDRAATSERAA